MTQTKLLWTKIGTRDRSFLFMDYILCSYARMRKLVGTAIRDNLLTGNASITTIYRNPEDVAHSYEEIRTRTQNPRMIETDMDNYEDYKARIDEVIYKIRNAADEQKPDKQQIMSLLREFDDAFLSFMCHQLFFVYMGYAAHIPEIKAFIQSHEARVNNIRMDNIYIEIDKQLPDIFSAANPELKALCQLMTRNELFAVLDGTPISHSTFTIINQRKQRYLRIMRNGEIIDIPPEEISDTLAQELAHIRIDRNQKEIMGTTAHSGNVRGKVCIILSTADYKKITRGSIIVTPMTVPDMLPFLKEPKAIVTNDGGTLNHASIVAREMNIPCITGTQHATDIFKDGDLVEVDATNGIVRRLN